MTNDQHAGQPAHQNHAGIPLYVAFLVVLAIITACEWAIFKFRVSLGISNFVLVAALSVMSLVKFFMVVGWYMHLRYDPKLLKINFIFAFLLVMGIALGLLTLMSAHG